MKQDAIKTERERAAKEKAAITATGRPGARPDADPEDPSGTWVHPRTGKIYTNSEVIAAEKAKIMEDSAGAEIKRRKAEADLEKFTGRLSDNEDITALWSYYTRMISAGLASIAASNHKLFVESACIRRRPAARPRCRWKSWCRI